MLVELRSDQVQDIRNLVNKELNRLQYRPAYLVGILQVLDNAETTNTRNWELLAEIKKEMGMEP